MKWFLLTALMFLGAAKHEYHISMIEMEYIESTESVEIAVKMFADDLERTLEKENECKLYLGIPDKESENLDTYLMEYVKEKLKIYSGEKELEYKLVGREMEDIALWLFIEVENVPSFEKVTVFCSILTELFDDQQNIIHVKKKKQRKSSILNINKHREVFDFK